MYYCHIVMSQSHLEDVVNINMKNLAPFKQLSYTLRISTSDDSNFDSNLSAEILFQFFRNKNNFTYLKKVGLI